MTIDRFNRLNTPNPRTGLSRLDVILISMAAIAFIALVSIAGYGLYHSTHPESAKGGDIIQSTKTK